MQRPYQIIFHGMQHSDAVETHIREKMEKLELFCSHIIGCKTTLEIAGKHKHQGQLFKVQLNITVPVKELVINHGEYEDIYVVLRDTYDAAKRQLGDYERHRRVDIKFHENILHEYVTKISPEGFGFIETPDDREFYFIRTNAAYPSFEKL
jgi:ribosome-associated translation inhibitor RaiA